MAREHRITTYLEGLCVDYSQMSDEDAKKFNDYLNRADVKTYIMDASIAVMQTSSHIVIKALAIAMIETYQGSLDINVLRRFTEATKGMMDRQAELFIKISKAEVVNSIPIYPLRNITSDNFKDRELQVSIDELFIDMEDFYSRGLLSRNPAQDNGGVFASAAYEGAEKSWSFIFAINNLQQTYLRLLSKAKEIHDLHSQSGD